MDIVHHSLIGGVGLSIATAAGEPLLGVAFIVGSIFPDLDVLFILFGKRFYLRNHQGITHSLLLAPFFSILLIAALFGFLSMDWNWLMVAVTLAGILLHICLDWFNTFQVALFSPLTHKRYSLDAVFFIDVMSLTLTLLFFVSYSYAGIEQTIWIYPSAMIFYFVSKLLLQRYVAHQLDALNVIPSSFNPLVFFVLEKRENDLLGYTYNALSGNKNNTVKYETVDKRFIELANKSSVFNDMKKITRAFFITSIEKTEQGTTITAQDIAVRNFGGKFAKTELKFDKNGMLLSEVANI